MVVRRIDFGRRGSMNLYRFAGESNVSLIIHDKFAGSDIQFNASCGVDNYLIGLRSDYNLPNHDSTLIIRNLSCMITGSNRELLLACALTANKALICYGVIVAKAVVGDRQVIVRPGGRRRRRGAGQTVCAKNLGVFIIGHSVHPVLSCWFSSDSTWLDTLQGFSPNVLGEVFAADMDSAIRGINKNISWRSQPQHLSPASFRALIDQLDDLPARRGNHDGLFAFHVN